LDGSEYKEKRPIIMNANSEVIRTIAMRQRLSIFLHFRGSGLFGK
jgi:hypothetical protein